MYSAYHTHALGNRANERYRSRVYLECVVLERGEAINVRGRCVPQ